MGQPHLLELNAAVAEIVRTCDDPHATLTRPFIFIIGAGVSFPSIPLSRDIIIRCQELLRGRGVMEPPQALSSLDAYSFTLQQAFPTPRQRQVFLRSLIEGRPISQASVRLADLLKDGKLASTVVTPNFDDQLSRALMLHGHPFIACDHPGTTGRIDGEASDLQIVQVHGSSWFYDCCNLRDEIEERASTSSEMPTMASLLDALFVRRSPIVIGYDGWEGDVIMGALRRRLRGALPCHLYWFAHERTALYRLPDWLIRHPHVRLVMPPPSSGLPRASVLSAVTVFDRMIEALGLEPPEFARSPLKIAVRMLRDVAPWDEPQDATDSYRFEDLLRRAEQAERKDVETSFDVPRTPALALAVHDDILREQERLIESGAGTPETYVRIANVFFSKARIFATLDRHEDALATLNELLRRFEHMQEPSIERQVERALINKAFWLVHLARSDDAIAASEQILVFLDRHKLRLQPLTVATALMAKINALLQAGEPSSVVEACDDLLRRFDRRRPPRLAAHIAGALWAKRIALTTLGRHDEALALTRALVRRFARHPELNLRITAGDALLRMAWSLEALGRRHEALELCDEAVKQFDGVDEQSLRDVVADSLTTKARTLDSLKRHDEEIGVCEGFLRRFGKTEDERYQKPIAGIVLNKALALQQSGRGTEALVVYDELLQRFGTSTDPMIREMVATGLNARGNILAGEGDWDDAASSYEDAWHRLCDASDPALDGLTATVLLNLGANLRCLDRTTEAIEVLDEVVRRWEDSPDPSLMGNAALAKVEKGLVLHKTERRLEAVALWEQVLEGLSADSPPDMKEAAGRAYFLRAMTLGEIPVTPEQPDFLQELLRGFRIDGA